MHKESATRLVVDSNNLSSERLRCFLEAKPTHYAVITDYAWMEAYKANSVPILKKSMSVLGQFTDQVLHLWGTKKVSGMDFRGAALGDMMVRNDAKKDFERLISNLRLLSDDAQMPWSLVTGHVAAAREHIEERLLSDIANTQGAFSAMQQFFSSAEIAAIRRNVPHSPELLAKVMWIVRQTSKGLAKSHPSILRGPSAKSYYNTFIFRYALAGAMYFLEWVRRGSQTTIKDEKIRNDIIDLNFALYGTYFNGVMSSDKNLQRYHSELRVALGYLGARMPKDRSYL